MTQFLVVLVTCPTRRCATKLANTIVRNRLAACVNILPNVESCFWWKGHVDYANETLLIIKTTARVFERLRQAVCALHPYEVPEVLALSIAAAHQPYLSWLRNSLGARKPPSR